METRLRGRIIRAMNFLNSMLGWERIQSSPRGGLELHPFVELLDVSNGKQKSLYDIYLSIHIIYQCTTFLYQVGWLLFLLVFGVNDPMLSQAVKFMEVHFGPVCPVFVLFLQHFFFNSDFILALVDKLWQWLHDCGPYGHDYIVDPNLVEGIWVQHSRLQFYRGCMTQTLWYLWYLSHSVPFLHVSSCYKIVMGRRNFNCKLWAHKFDG